VVATLSRSNHASDREVLIMAKYTYNVLYKSNPNKRGLSPSFKTIAEAKFYYIHSRNTMVEHKGLEYLNDIDEVVVYKNWNFHNYYDVDFKLKKSGRAAFRRSVLGDLERTFGQLG